MKGDESRKAVRVGVENAFCYLSTVGRRWWSCRELTVVRRWLTCRPGGNHGSGHDSLASIRQQAPRMTKGGSARTSSIDVGHARALESWMGSLALDQAVWLSGKWLCCRLQKSGVRSPYKWGNPAVFAIWCLPSAPGGGWSLIHSIIWTHLVKRAFRMAR